MQEIAPFKDFIIELNDLKLTDEQAKHAVEMFAHGSSRQSIATHFIENDERFIAAVDEHGEKAVRSHLSQILRSTDPSSTLFARNKYGELFELHRQAIIKALANQYKIAIGKSVEQLQENLSELIKQSEPLRKVIERADDIEIENPKDYIAAINTHLKIQKAIQETQDKLLERLERIRNQADPF